MTTRTRCKTPAPATGLDRIRQRVETALAAIPSPLTMAGAPGLPVRADVLARYLDDAHGSPGRALGGLHDDGLLIGCPADAAEAVRAITAWRDRLRTAREVCDHLHAAVGSYERADLAVAAQRLAEADAAALSGCLHAGTCAVLDVSRALGAVWATDDEPLWPIGRSVGWPVAWSDLGDGVILDGSADPAAVRVALAKAAALDLSGDDVATMHDVGKLLRAAGVRLAILDDEEVRL